MGGELSKECIAYTMVICGEIKNVGFRRFIWSLVKRLYDELSEYYYIVKDDRWEEHKFQLNDEEKIKIADYGSSLALKFNYYSSLPKDEIIKAISYYSIVVKKRKFA